MKKFVVTWAEVHKAEISANTLTEAEDKFYSGNYKELSTSDTLFSEIPEFTEVMKFSEEK